MYQRTFLTIAMLVALLLATYVPAPAFAASGDLDATFGAGGRVVTNIASYNANDYLAAIAVRSDGSIVTAGYSDDTLTHQTSLVQATLARFTAQGHLDFSFGDSYQPGRISRNIGAASDYVSDMDLLPDGKLLLAGVGGFSLARFNADGTLDPTFGNSGWIADGVGLRAALRLGTGKIVGLVASDNDFVLRRYNANGTVDSSFGTNGTVVTDFGGTKDYAFDLIAAVGDKLAVSGYSGTDFALARYNANGSLDTSFSGDGLVTTDMGSSSDYGYSLVQQAGGKLILGGSAGASYALARYKSNGELDNSFSGDGKLVLSLGPRSRGARVALQPDGKILMDGASDYGNGAIIRLNADGSLDMSFGQGGMVGFIHALPFTNMVVRPDGKILAGGSYWESIDHDGAMLLQLNPDGSLDQQFGASKTPGKEQPGFGRGPDEGLAVAVQADDKVLAAGTSGGHFSLIRYNADGSRDAGFGDDGMVLSDYCCGTQNDAALAIQPDGKILMAYTVGGVYLGVQRFNPDGRPDTTFNGSGQRMVGPLAAAVYGIGLAIQANGSIVVGGANGGDFAVTRLLVDGRTDSKFGSGGWAVADMGSPGDFGGIALQGGKIVLAGTADQNFVLMRLLSTGALDTTFGKAGRAVTDFGQNDAVRGVAVRSDGKIIASGWTTNPSSPQFALAAYSSNGAPDLSFSGDGKQTTDFGGAGAYSDALLLQADGKIVLGGVNTPGPGANSEFALARYDSVGNLDPSFGSAGRVTTAFADGAAWVNSLALTASGKILAAGTTNADFALARYSSTSTAPTKADAEK